VVPDTPKLPALTVSEFPFVLKLPLSAIPQVGALMVGCPLISTPISFDGRPNVVMQLLPGPEPVRFVATARAVTVFCPTPKIFMK
jgi:hypothetical protein